MLYVEHVPVEIGVFIVDSFVVSLVLGLLEISELVLLLLSVCLLTLGWFPFQKLLHHLS
jgi:hypothetical protein